jgi:hypothetical protein
MSSLFPHQEADVSQPMPVQGSTRNPRSRSGSIGRTILLTLGGMAVVAAFFFGTLFVLDYLEPRGRERDAIRADHVRSLKAALERYRASRGNYPFPFPGNPLTHLKKELVDGGYLPAIPQDPLWGVKDNSYQYVSPGGQNYGVLVHLEAPTGAIAAGGACVTGVNTAGTGWWGQPPPCPF